MKSLVSLIASLVFTSNLLFPQHVFAKIEDPASALQFTIDKALISQFEIDQSEVERLANELAVLENATIVKSWRVITAYSSTPDQTDATPFITAQGTRVRDGIVAANFLPFGTKVRIPALFGDKVFVVEDRMNKRHASRLDVWFETRWQAREFGIRVAQIEVLK